MKCTKCGSENVSVQITNEVTLKNKHHGLIWWICIGWWWFFVKWIVLTIPALIAKIFIPKKQKAVNKKVKNAICQDCGYSWEI